METFFGIIVGLVVLTLLVVAHEAGHFIMARRNGVNVLEFGIGFPPRAVAWIRDPKTHKWRKLKKAEWDSAGVMKTVIQEEKKVKTVEKSAKNAELLSAPESGGHLAAEDKKLLQDGLVFSINWLPIGGFCQMDGESAEDERKGTFGYANFWQKTKILFGGVVMNWLVAFIIFTILAWTGMPVFLENQFAVEADTRTEGGGVVVSSVIEGSPAAEAGFREEDKILKAGDVEIMIPSEVIEYNSAHAGEQVTYTVSRKEKVSTGIECFQAPCPEAAEEKITEVELPTTLNSTESEYLLGITMGTSQSLSYSTWSAPIVGAGLTLQITGETFKGVGELVWNLITGTGRLFSFDQAMRESGQEALSTVGDSVSGPVGIIGVLFPSFTAAGPSNLAFLAALISISLACMNVLPIPALDGGRWLLIGIYKLRGKKLTKETEQKIVSRAMFVLLALMAIVTILDITRFF